MPRGESLYGKGKVNILDGDYFNNHGLAYSDTFYTKHILTGIWGKDALTKPNKLKSQFINEVNKYGQVGNNFDFYIDYTNGGYLKRNRTQEEVNNSVFDVNIQKSI